MEKLLKNKTALYVGVGAAALLVLYMAKGGGSGGGSMIQSEQIAANTDVALNAQAYAYRTARAQSDAALAVKRSSDQATIITTFMNTIANIHASNNNAAVANNETQAGVTKAAINATAQTAIAKSNNDAQIAMAPIMANEQTALARIAGSTSNMNAQYQYQATQAALQQQTTNGFIGLAASALPAVIKAVSGLFSSGAPQQAASAIDVGTGAIGGGDYLGTAGGDLLSSAVGAL